MSTNYAAMRVLTELDNQKLIQNMQQIKLSY